MKFTIKPLDTLLLEAYQNKDKKAATKILSEVKKNPKHKMLYALVDNLKNGSVPTTDVDAFINENIEMAKTLQISKLKPLFENKDTESDTLMQAITTLLFEGKTAMNMSDYYKSFAIVRENLKAINTSQEDFNEELTSFGTAYESLDSADKVIVENFFKTPYSQRATIFESLAKECVDLLSENIKESTNTNEKLKLYEAKDMISNYKFSDENFVEHLVNLHELKKDLS